MTSGWGYRVVSGLILSSVCYSRGFDRPAPTRAGLLRGALLALSALTALVASPAAANPIGDCFERIAIAFHPHHAYHATVAHPSIHRVRHVGPRRPPSHRIAAVGPTAAYALRSRYVLRPRACETHPAVALMSPAPGAVLPQTPQVLLAELAGPAAAAAPETAVNAAEQAPAFVGAAPETSLATPDVGPSFPGLPGGVFGGPGPAGGGVFPGGPGPVTPPDTQPVAPPIVDVPPTVVGLPPPVIEVPPTLPGGPLPLVDVPPGLPSSGPAGGVPEPTTWAMLIAGCFGVGGALRRRAVQA